MGEEGAHQASFGVEKSLMGIFSGTTILTPGKRQGGRLKKVLEKEEEEKEEEEEEERKDFLQK
jgi:hypothetical protein